MPNKLTYEFVKNFIESEGYKLLSKEYINATTKLLIECPNGHQYLVSFNKFKQGRRCPICNRKNISKRKTLKYNDVKSYIEQFNYELISEEYINAHQKLKIKCDKGHIFEMNFNNFKSRNRCPICNKKEKTLSIKEVEKRIAQEGHTLIGGYKNSREKIIIKCPNGHTYTQSYNYFRNNIRCPICHDINKKNKEKNKYNQVKTYIENEGYKLLSEEYKNNKEKLLIQCDKKHIYESTFDNFKQGYRCPICNSSKGEKEIGRILEKMQINYIVQYKFDNCKFKQRLPFDFYLPDYNCCIEYDGVQHFEIVKHFGGYDGFITRKIKDTIKNIYCEQNNIKLIRIPYWQFDNIEKILKENNINK